MAKKGSKVFAKLKELIFSAQIFPLLLSFTALAILFVLFRMKSVEQDYVYNNLNKDLREVSIENKELNAKKADLLSIENMRKIAEKYNLKEANQDQIIIVP